MHINNYAHLDIKPANIVLNEHRESKLIDFGSIYNITTGQQKGVIGSPFYMSPEMIELRVSSAQKCDVYSLGISFIECAFAFHYYDKYIECIKPPVAKLFNSILRYVPIDVSSSQSYKLNLLKITIQIDSTTKVQSLAIPSVVHETKTILFKKNMHTDTGPIDYTLGDLYNDIRAIHDKYPIFKKMIVINPDNRCSIADVISEC